MPTAPTQSIKDYSNWIVKDARSDCAALPGNVKLEVANGQDGDPKVEAATIERNAETSAPGTAALPGGIVSVVIFPLEPRH